MGKQKIYPGEDTKTPLTASSVSHVDETADKNIIATSRSSALDIDTATTICRSPTSSHAYEDTTSIEASTTKWYHK